MYFLNDSKRIQEQEWDFSLLDFFSFYQALCFSLDSSLIIMANLSFFIGLCLLIAIKSKLHFFLKKGKLKGRFIFIIILKITINGFPLQIDGLFQMFKSFLPFLYDSATKFPIIVKPQLKKIVDEFSARGPSV